MSKLNQACTVILVIKVNVLFYFVIHSTLGALFVNVSELKKMLEHKLKRNKKHLIANTFKMLAAQHTYSKSLFYLQRNGLLVRGAFVL